MIRYRFEFSDSDRIEFDLEEGAGTSIEADGYQPPDWIKLEQNRCKRCTVPEGSRRSCPAALAFDPLLQKFGTRISYEKVWLTVEINDVTMQGELPTQRAVRSLAGLRLALSDCPIMRKLKPMAHFHLPFGDREQTAFRFLGMHLIGQVLRLQEGLQPDWELDGLRKLAADLHMVNIGLAKRIRSATEKDAAANSVVMLDTLATTVELGLKEGLETLKPLFEAYLNP